MAKEKKHWFNKKKYNMSFLEILGLSAGTITSITFLPQVIQIWKTKSAKDLSLSMLGLLIIGVLIIVIAWVNYINLATAKSMERAKEVGMRKVIGAQLSQVMGKEVLAHFHDDAEILGGVIVRVGDRVFDGSVRRKMTVLRRTLLAR